jgi:hypothetical protein
MRRGTKPFRALLLSIAVLTALIGGIVAWAATKGVDLDGNGTAESSVALNILQSFPAKIQNVVTNKAVGDSFTFKWPSAGPGGFNSTLATGTSTGVGTIWTWQTSQAVYSFTGSTCANDICFSATGGLPAGTARGPFGVPGRSLTTSGVTLSSGSLTSSLLTFFSPLKVVFSATSKVEQPGAGQIAYSATLSNTSAGALTVHIDPGPPGCCPNSNELNCSGTCVDYLTDPNDCGGCGVQCNTEEGQSCTAGSCTAVCPTGQTPCGTQCVDLTSDPLNCGECGTICDANQVCEDSACQACESPNSTACANVCVDTTSDPLNCGACGVSCTSACTGSGTPFCSEGDCGCSQIEDLSTPSGLAAPATSQPPTIDTLPAATSLPTPAPVCLTQTTTQTIPSGQSISLGCNTSTFLAQEVVSLITLCLDGSTPNPTTGLCADGSVPATGPFMQLVPDPSHPVNGVDVALTPVAVSLRDRSGDGLWEPGETAQITIYVVNAGSATFSGACATISSPPQDITPADGISNPTTVDILQGTACYPDIPGTPAGSGGCSSSVVNPVGGSTPFAISVPVGYLGDTSRLFILHFNGTANGSPVSQDVPITLGIAGNCDPTDVQGNFDGLQGLGAPMAALVPEDDGQPLPFPTKASVIGSMLPLKLTMKCGSLTLNADDTLAPKIVALVNLTTHQPVDITLVNINSANTTGSPNVNDPFFRFSSPGTWIYNMRTAQLSAGRYRLTIQIDGRKNYVTGFELR